MKAFKIFIPCAVLCMGLTACGGASSDTEVDTSLLTGAEVVSDDGSVSILLPDESFTMSDSSDGGMFFESEDEGYISLMWGKEEENNKLYDTVPETEDDVLAMFEGINANVELKDFSFDEKDGTKYFTSAVKVSNYIDETAETETGGTEPQGETFIVIENFKSDGSEYYYGNAEVNDDSLIEKTEASLATFGKTE